MSEFPTYIVEYIRGCQDKTRHLNKSMLEKKSTKEIRDWLETFPFSIRILNSMITKNHTSYDWLKCAVCGKPLTESQIISGSSCCSHKCSSSTEQFKNKIKSTNLSKYGTEFPCQNKEIDNKRISTNIEKYGKTIPMKIEEIKAKRIQTNLSRYGVEDPINASDVREKYIATCIEKYGYSNCQKNQDVRQKVQKSKRSNQYDLYVNILKEKKISVLFDKQQFVEGDVNLLKYKCDKCGLEFKSDILSSHQIYCPKCIHDRGRSGKEIELAKYIKSIYSGEVLTNNRKALENRELDVYIPNLNLAFEFNGNYWHSENKLNDDSSRRFIPKSNGKIYHQDKTLRCRDRGIRLIHIFEYEWDLKKEKIQALIRSSLGIYQHVVYARKCEIREIDFKTYSTFLDQYHLQGKTNSPIRYGLFYDNQLISVIGFGQSRFKKGEIELHRYCVKHDYKVIGGFSKLIKHSDIKDFISYVDLAHFDGKGYNSVGFETLSITEPNYVYVKGSNDCSVVISRHMAQKHKLPKLLNEKFDASKSEVENMTINGGYDRVYDCGNLKVRYKST